jgi:hypothetical protein
MSLPTQIVVSPHTIRVAYVRNPQDGDGTRVFGLYDAESLSITVDSAMSPTRTAEILLHETLHALNDASRFVDEDAEEAVVEALAPALIRLIQDNPQLMAQLLAYATK